LSRIDVDVIVQIPLEDEYKQFSELFAPKEAYHTDINLRYIVDAPSDLRVLVVLQNGMGRGIASSTCSQVLSEFDCKLYACLGIAASLTKDLSLGDVCYTGNLIDVYDNSKVIDVVGSGIDLAFDPAHYQTKESITAAIGFVRTLTELRHLQEYWQETQQAFAENLLSGEIEGRKGQFEKIGIPKSLNGEIVCGPVVESENYTNKLKGITRKILAVETESGAVFDLCRRRGVDAIAIRGISDYGANKGDLESTTGGAVRIIAARNAVSFLHMQLQNPILLKALGRLAPAQNGLADLPEVASASKNPIPALIETLGSQYDQKLRELSPQYRTKPAGYRLPTPRAKPMEDITGGDGRKSPPLEILSAINQYQRLVLSVPKTYPDPGLPYIIASGLLLLDSSGKKLIPVVLEGSKISPPSSGLLSSSGVRLPDEIASSGGEYVFIIDNPNLSSKTKLSFLVDEIKSLSDSKVILITKENKNFVLESDVARKISGEILDICDVSFAEMAAFIEQSFEVPSTEAEVIALKLRTTFDRFSLPAHPSFFAGIPSEMLFALLQANRRSELIQLAVDGFLSFIVADDKDPVRLSRSKRAQFLRQVVLQNRLEKRSFTQADLVQHADDMSREFDYDLQSISFVQGFIDKGLIHVDGGYAKITLPFMESYFLAVELAQDPDLAERYFNTGDDDFDLLTFDLYCEIGPSVGIVSKVTTALEEAIKDISAEIEGHALLDGKVYPKILRNPARIIALGSRISAARAALDSDASDRQEKIRILDVADRIQGDMASKNDEETERKSFGINEHALFNNLMRSWVISTVLVGSGAESIKGDSRASLVSLLLKGADWAMNAWTQIIDALDYDELKKEVLNDKEFQSTVGIEDDKEYSKLVDVLVDFMEYLALSQPVEAILNQLLDDAQQKIIGNSLLRSKDQVGLVPFIRGLWLTNIDKEAGEEQLASAISDLPDARFLRNILTSLLIYRVKWKMSGKVARYHILDAAESIIKPVNPNLDKGEIQRFVDRNPLSDKQLKSNDN
jgi:nucleoside phosphorylase